ncbi:MAG: hypothetical protein COA38_13450 [Fluviicola sp.]|nr:MAG: hypothetical protein COA38_13450 [Fluviicola sp.]
MEWYLPITILPGLGMLIFSTTSQMMTISTEVGGLLSNKCSDFDHNIAKLKIKQIKRLTYASTLLYVAAGSYTLSGIIGAVLSQYNAISHSILFFGTACVLVSLVLLVVYAFKTINIRQMQFENNHLL